METSNQQPLLGGEWIIKESTLASTFIPEEFNEEQQMVKTCVINLLTQKFYLL